MVLLYGAGCANQVTPEGGPRDTDPPRVLNSIPPNLSPRITETSFRIDFDEFVDLKNPMNEIFISPPLKKPMETRLRGKSLIIRLLDTLAANTTYSISFGNALTDLTEGNILTGFRYVFSTGDRIDSLSLRGNVAGAFDRQPQKDVIVALYLDHYDTIPFDSLPLRVPPFYITKTDPQGNFTFSNLRQGPFKLFALNDQNGDLIFNQPTEKIAFSDSLALPYYMTAPSPCRPADSLIADSTAKPNTPALHPDSIRQADSARRADSIRISLLRYPSYSLSLFEQHDSVQRIVKSSFPARGMALMVFRYPVRELKITPLNFDSAVPWCRMEYTRKADSVRLWITRPGTDSLIARVTAGSLVPDTVRLGLAFGDISRKPKKSDTPDRLTANLLTGTAGLNQFLHPLMIDFSSPLERWDFSQVLLIDENDTIRPSVSFADSLKKRIIVGHPWEEFHSCRIFFPDSIFFGINGLANDTARLDFKTRGERDFGNLTVMVNGGNHPGQLVLQLMNEKESVIYGERIVEGSQKVTFPWLLPGRYKLKEIRDRNRNGRWDTGDYSRKIQPEEVRYFPKALEIRGNWDVEESWD